MSILGWILFGLVVGVVAKFLIPGRDPGGFVITVILGIVGAVVGGFVGRTLGWYGPGDAVGFGMALLGALILLVAYRALAGRPPARRAPGTERKPAGRSPLVHTMARGRWCGAPRAEAGCRIGTTFQVLPSGKDQRHLEQDHDYQPGAPLTAQVQTVRAPRPC